MMDFAYNGSIRLCVGGSTLRETRATVTIIGQKITIASNVGRELASGDYKDVVLQLIDRVQQIRIPDCCINQKSLNPMSGKEKELVEITALAVPDQEYLFVEPLDPSVCGST